MYYHSIELSTNFLPAFWFSNRSLRASCFSVGMDSNGKILSCSQKWVCSITAKTTRNLWLTDYSQ